MNGNCFGKIFQITTWGESHGPALGVVIDGCPSGLPLSSSDFEADMSLRQGGKADFATPRSEKDIVMMESGVFEGFTTGTPIALRIQNENTQSKDYEEFRERPRPGHADLTTFLKHQHRDHRGGGRSSARETAARVAAGVVAKKILVHYGISLLAWVDRIGPTEIPADETLSLNELRSLRNVSPLRVATLAETQTEILASVERLRTAGDSWGGSLRCRIDNLPVGLGEPIFDKLGALLSHALMSLPAATAIQIGGGFSQSFLPGSAIRDAIENTDAGPRPASNIHGGLLGGITTGLPLQLALSFHAPTSIPRPIQTVDLKTKEEVTISVEGRHDAFPLPRAVPMVEAMVAITLVDAMMRAGRIPEKL